MREKEAYREKIINMVQKIHRCDILIYIYKAVCGIIKEDYDDGTEH